MQPPRSDEPPPPVRPVPSASVLLVRTGRTGIELFMVRRHPRSSVLPNAYVFPGGTVRPDDYDGPWSDPRRAAALRRRLTRRSDVSIVARDAAAIFACAARELFEEAGVLLARPKVGSRVGGEQVAALVRQREALERGELSFPDLLVRDGLELRTDLLIPFSNWVTPPTRPWRFNTWFFVARQPRGQEAVFGQVEASAGAWVRPQDVLDAANRGEHEVIYPTAMHLHRATAFARADDLLAFARTKAIRRIQPRFQPGEPDLRILNASDLDLDW